MSVHQPMNLHRTKPKLVLQPEAASRKPGRFSFDKPLVVWPPDGLIFFSGEEIFACLNLLRREAVTRGGFSQAKQVFEDHVNGKGPHLSFIELDGIVAAVCQQPEEDL